MNDRTEERAADEARFAANRAKQAAWRVTPEAKAIRQARIDQGLCVIEDSRCVTHDAPDTLAHHFSVTNDSTD